MDFFRWRLDSDARKRMRGLSSFSVGALERPEATSFEGAFARVLDDDGPLLDVIAAGADLLVSERLRAFLEAEVPGEVRLHAVRLRFATKDGIGYSLLRCLHQHDDVEPPFKDVRERIFLGGGGGMHRPPRIFVREDLVEALIAAGFAGLGFDNVTGTRMAGGAERDFPEVEVLARWREELPREENAPALVSRVSSMLEAREAWQETLRFLRARIGSEHLPGGLDRVDFEAAASACRVWLASVVASSPVPLDINALWFGIRESESGGAYVVQVSGSSRFAPLERYDSAWAESRFEWMPPDELAIASFTRPENTNEAHRLFATVVLPWAYVAILIASVARSREGAPLLRGSAQSRWLAVGWDGGDGRLLGSVGDAGYVPDRE